MTVGIARRHRPARGHVGARRSPRPVRRAARARRPCTGTSIPNAEGFWAITKHADVKAISHDVATFSTEVGSRSSSTRTDGAMEFHRMTLLQMDPPKHNRYRRLVSAGFTPRMITMLIDSIDDARQEHRRARRRPRRDRVHDGHRRRAADAGDLRDDRHPRGGPAPRHRAGQPAWSAPRIPTSSRPRRTASSPSAEIYALCDELAADRRQHPRDDIMSILVHAEVDGDRLTETELNLFFVLLVVAGNETTRNLIAHAMLALIEHPDARAELVAGIDDDELWATADRGDAPLGRVDPQLPPHGHARHRDPRRARSRQGRQGRHVLRVGQPRRGGVRRLDDASTSAARRTTT